MHSKHSKICFLTDLFTIITLFLYKRSVRKYQLHVIPIFTRKWNELPDHVHLFSEDLMVINHPVFPATSKPAAKPLMSCVQGGLACSCISWLLQLHNYARIYWQSTDGTLWCHNTILDCANQSKQSAKWSRLKCFASKCSKHDKKNYKDWMKKFIPITNTYSTLSQQNVQSAICIETTANLQYKGKKKLLHT